MGIHNSDITQKALISMQNGDIYTVQGTAAALIGDFVDDTENLKQFILIEDIKSNNEVWVAVAQISSVVNLGDGNGRG